MSFIENIRNTLFEHSMEKNNYSKAVKEWYWKGSYDVREVELVSSIEDYPDCELCGHKHIREVCVIKNTKNNNELGIGNECINKFISKEIGEKHKSEMKEIRKKIKAKIDSKKFKSSGEYKKYLILDLIFADAGNWRKWFNKIKSRVDTKGAPTKKQLSSLIENYNKYKDEQVEDVFVYISLLEKDVNDWERSFLSNMAKFKIKQSRMTPAQLNKLNEISNKYAD